MAAQISCRKADRRLEFWKVWPIEGPSLETTTAFIFSQKEKCRGLARIPRGASGPGSGAESPSSWDTGRGRKGSHPLARQAPHVRGQPCAKPFVDDLLLGRGFVCSRAAPSLQSILSQPSLQGFVKRKKKKCRGHQGQVVLLFAGPRLFLSALLPLA